MKIRLHVALPGAPILKRQISLRLPDGTTVEEVLADYAQKYGASGLAGDRIGISVLVNGSLAGADQELRDKDRLEVFRPMTRG